MGFHLLTKWKIWSPNGEICSANGIWSTLANLLTKWENVDQMEFHLLTNWKNLLTNWKNLLSKWQSAEQMALGPH